MKHYINDVQKYTDITTYVKLSALNAIHLLSMGNLRFVSILEHMYLSEDVRRRYTGKTPPMTA